MVRFDNVTLEMSLKPFRDASDGTMQAVCRTLFTQWLALLRETERVSVLLWTADGSEILDYRGSLDDTFEWAKWIGVANPQHPIDPGNPACNSIHHRPRLYTPTPPEFTYGWLKQLVAVLKGIGADITGRPIRVGATFDPGPEFARSSFKYERHREVCLGNTMGKASMICCYARLKGDDSAYAGYPDGIPDGIPFGEFLGRQTRRFAGDLGFDYLWLSNGFGFGLETWGLRGAVFDGSTFASDRCAEVREKSMIFWQTFRHECPDLPLETRGTNLSTGMDLASDAVPLREIYDSVPGLMPPPNSPWAALNSDFGLELVGWMSHIAQIPGKRFPFRFYTHDPWFLNSPWLDRYQREPHDIYLPLSVSRVAADGTVHVPTALEFLTVDDSYGRMPDQVPNEVIPHILAARTSAPDRPGPLVWVYPFDEYHDMTFGTPNRIDEVFFGDWFMRGAVNNGLPLNTVVSTANIATLLDASPDTFAESVLVSPVPDHATAWADAILSHVAGGGRALLYGPIAYADGRVLSALNLARDSALEGEFELDVDTPGDRFETQPQATRLQHHSLFCGGGMPGVCVDAADPATRLLAVARQGNASRVAALTRACPDWHGGRVAWVRGTVSCDPDKTGGHLLVPLDPASTFPAEVLMRYALTAFGIELLNERVSADVPTPMLCISRHRNAFVFAGFTANTTSTLRLRTPPGAPLFSGLETRLVAGRAQYTMPRAWLRECRAFIDQSREALVGCRIRRSGLPGVSRRLELTGLHEATVRFFHEPGTAARVEMRLESHVPCLTGELLEHVETHDALGHYLQVDGVSGQIMISW